MQRKHWIDIARGICMAAILYDHTELYYTGDNIIPYHLYVTNALIAFYFISGYLFYKSETFYIKRKMSSIFRSLLRTYLIFTTLMATPKAWIHQGELSLTDAFLNIILGKASWFVASLIMAEIIFSIIIHVCKGKTWALSTFSTVCLLLSIYLSTQQPSYPWQINNALQAVFVLYIGYMYHRHEDSFQRFNTPLYTSLLLIFLILLKIYERLNDVKMFISPIVIDNYLVFFIDVLLATWLLMRLCQWLASRWSCSLLTYTGKHSIIYYFLCGGIPMLVTMALEKAKWAYDGRYWLVPVAFVIVYVVATVFTMLYMATFRFNKQSYK